MSAPPADVKVKVLKEIAREHNINWDSTQTETELSKKPEDLLVPVTFTLIFPSNIQYFHVIYQQLHFNFFDV